MAKYYCANCGMPLEEDAAFCSGCGAPTRNPVSAQPVDQAPEQPVEPAFEPQQERPVYQAPAEPAYQPPVQQPAYQQPAYQPCSRFISSPRRTIRSRRKRKGTA